MGGGIVDVNIPERRLVAICLDTWEEYYFTFHALRNKIECGMLSLTQCVNTDSHLMSAANLVRLYA